MRRRPRDEVSMAPQIIGSPGDPALLALRWSTPLEEWPGERMVAPPRGISRHIVRFVRISGQVYAVKEVIEVPWASSAVPTLVSGDINNAIELWAQAGTNANRS